MENNFSDIAWRGGEVTYLEVPKTSKSLIVDSFREFNKTFELFTEINILNSPANSLKVPKKIKFPLRAGSAQRS